MAGVIQVHEHWVRSVVRKTNETDSIDSHYSHNSNNHNHNSALPFNLRTADAIHSIVGAANHRCCALFCERDSVHLLPAID